MGRLWKQKRKLVIQNLSFCILIISRCKKGVITYWLHARARTYCSCNNVQNLNRREWPFHCAPLEPCANDNAIYTHTSVQHCHPLIRWNHQLDAPTYEQQFCEMHLLDLHRIHQWSCVYTSDLWGPYVCRQVGCRQRQTNWQCVYTTVAQSTIVR